MTILQMVLILVIFQWALRVPREPARDRERTRRSSTRDRADRSFNRQDAA